MELATTLFRTGRAHAGAACLLYRAAVEHAAEEGIDDPVDHVFNGQNSLSIMHLLGLGVELMLKSAIVALDAEADEKFLRHEIGHGLVNALDEAEKRGFSTNTPHLRKLVTVLHDTYAKHWFRYGRPSEFALPDNFDQVVAILEGLEQDVTAIIAAAEPPGG